MPMWLSLCVVSESHLEDSTELGAGEWGALDGVLVWALKSLS